MQLPKFLKISLLVILFMAVAAYIVYAFVGMKSTNPDEICQEVTYVFEEEGADVVVDSTVVSNMLVEADIFPQGKKMSVWRKRRKPKQKSFIPRWTVCLTAITPPRM